MTGLLERLLDYRAVMNDENKTYSMSCTVNLLVGTCPMPPAPRGEQGSAPRPSRSPRGCGAPGTAEMGCTQCQTRIPLGDSCWWALGSSPLQGQPSPCMGRVTQSKAQEPGGAALCALSWGHSDNLICSSPELLQGDRPPGHVHQVRGLPGETGITLG